MNDMRRSELNRKICASFLRVGNAEVPLTFVNQKVKACDKDFYKFLHVLHG